MVNCFSIIIYSDGGGGVRLKVFLDLFWFFKQEKRAYLSGILMLAVVALLILIPPRVIGIVVDEIDNHTLTGTKLITWIAALLLSGLAMYGLRYYWRIRIFGSAVKLARLLRNQLYHHFTRMSRLSIKNGGLAI